MFFSFSVSDFYLVMKFFVKDEGKMKKYYKNNEWLVFLWSMKQINNSHAVNRLNISKQLLVESIKTIIKIEIKSVLLMIWFMKQLGK